jgi:hypothetical protein
MTGPGWATILVLLIAVVWLLMALLDTQAQLREYRRHVGRLLRESSRSFEQARHGSDSPSARWRRRTGGDAS